MKRGDASGSNPVPYGTEMHATRYQYGFALTPGRLRVAGRAVAALQGLCAIGEVAGNHGRFLFDFSPDSVIFRLTPDPAPRILYAFDIDADGAVSLSELLRKVKSKDIPAAELVLGGAVVSSLDAVSKTTLTGAALHDGVRAAAQAVCDRVVKGGP